MIVFTPPAIWSWVDDDDDDVDDDDVLATLLLILLLLFTVKEETSLDRRNRDNIELFRIFILIKLICF